MLCCFVVCFVFCFCFRSLVLLQVATLDCSWYGWGSKIIWCVVACVLAYLFVFLFVNYFLYVSVPICLICFGLECLTVWLIDRLIDRSSDWSINWLSAWLIVGWLHLVLFFGFIWFGTFRTCLASHGHCDPCEFLLALRSFIELVSVMVKFRTSMPIRPQKKRIEDASFAKRFAPMLSQARSDPCMLSARSGLQGLRPPPAEFLKPKSM